MQCPNCGASITQKQAFCTSCGTHFPKNQYNYNDPAFTRPDTLTLGERVYLIIMLGGLILQYMFAFPDPYYAYIAPVFLGLFKDKDYPKFGSFSPAFMKSLLLVIAGFSYVFYKITSDSTDTWGKFIFTLLAPILLVIINMILFVVSIIAYTVGFMLFKLLRT